MKKTKEIPMPQPEKLSEREREKTIDALEKERLLANRQIEDIVNQYAKESGIRSLVRKKRVGTAKNDYVVKRRKF